MNQQHTPAVRTDAAAHDHATDLRRPASKGRRAAIAVAGVVLFALATALSAHVRAPLPGTPVPMTLQTLAVLLAGVTLGPWFGTAAMGFYLLLGMCGAPAFADAVWKDGVFFGATGGYLVGFVLAQPAIGLAARARSLQRGRAPAWPRLLLAGALGHAIIFACGLAWLAAWAGTDLPRTLELGLWPFMLGTVIKTALTVAAGGATARAFDRLTAPAGR